MSRVGQFAIHSKIFFFFVLPVTSFLLQHTQDTQSKITACKLHEVHISFMIASLFSFAIFRNSSLPLFSRVKQYSLLLLTPRNMCYTRVKDEAGAKRALQCTSQWMPWLEILPKDCCESSNFIAPSETSLRPKVYMKLYKKTVNCTMTSTLLPFSLIYNTFTLLISC